MPSADIFELAPSQGTVSRDEIRALTECFEDVPRIDTHQDLAIKMISTSCAISYRRPP